MNYFILCVILYFRALFYSRIQLYFTCAIFFTIIFLYYYFRVLLFSCTIIFAYYNIVGQIHVMYPSITVFGLLFCQ